MLSVNIKETATLLRNNDDFVVLCHKSPDGDTLGSAFALCLALENMGKKVKLAPLSSVPSKLEQLVYTSKNENFDESFVISVDVADICMLDKDCDKYKGNVFLCIDHHISNSSYAQNLLLDENASATCEIMFDLLQELDVKINLQMANALYTGMCTDTGCFKYSNVTPKTFRTAAKLIEFGAEHAKINRIMFDTKSYARLKLESAVVSNMQSFFEDKCKLTYINLDTISSANAQEDDIDGLSSIPRQVEGTLVGVFLREKEDIYKVSVRTSGEVDASEICKRLSGGGHICAAGCELPKDFNKAKNMILDAVKEELKNGKSI